MRLTSARRSKRNGERNKKIVDDIKSLSDSGVDVPLVGTNGRTAIYYLCGLNNNENIVDAINVLIEKGIDKNFKDKGGKWS